MPQYNTIDHMKQLSLFLLLCAGLWICAPHQSAAQYSPLPQNDKELITIDLSKDQIDVTSAFSGTDVTLFGIQKAKGDIVLVVRGPSLNRVLREKSQVIGLWLTTNSVKFSDIPGFYAVASNANINNLAPESILARNQIGLDSLNMVPMNKQRFQRDGAGLTRFQEAFIQTQQINGLFVLRTAPITYITDELFKITLWFPSNIPVGEYKIDAYLFDNGDIKSQHHKTLVIARAGFNASLKDFSNDRPWLYALMTILIAMISGWMATVLLRRD